jgi:hypothetical protein
MKRFSLFCLIFLSSCVVQRSVVRQPNLRLHITDGTAPIVGATLYLYWLSDPYSRLEQTQTFTTDAEGKVTLEEILQTDVAYPLVMHGVTYYKHLLCLEARGYLPLVINFVFLPGDEVRLDVPLSAGDGLEVCNRYESIERNAYSAVPRPDITGQHESVRGAYEVVMK